MPKSPTLATGRIFWAPGFGLSATVDACPRPGRKRVGTLARSTLVANGVDEDDAVEERGRVVVGISSGSYMPGPPYDPSVGIWALRAGGRGS
jgi:hypothetical protein